MENNLEYKISQNLKMEIKTCGKRKSEIAAALNLSEKTISTYISGRSQPTLATLSRLCNFIDCSADDILEIKK